jgi:hypothetical protein
MYVQSENLEIIRGDSKSYLLEFTDGAGLAKDITGWVVFFTVTDNLEAVDDSHAQIVKTVTVHTDPTHGKTTINLLSTDTNLVGDYYYDIQVKYDGKVETIVSGVITFNVDATKRSS